MCDKWSGARREGISIKTALKSHNVIANSLECDMNTCRKSRDSIGNDGAIIIKSRCYYCIRNVRRRRHPYNDISGVVHWTQNLSHKYCDYVDCTPFRPGLGLVSQHHQGEFPGAPPP